MHLVKLPREENVMLIGSLSGCTNHMIISQRLSA